MYTNVKAIKLFNSARVPKFRDRAYLTAHTPEQSINIKPNTHAVVKTGIAFELPTGVDIRINSIREGKGLFVVNDPHKAYRILGEEVTVTLYNSTDKMVTVMHGETIAGIELVNTVKPRLVIISSRQ